MTLPSIGVVPLSAIVTDLAGALKMADLTAPQGKSATRQYLPGIGPLTEAALLALALGQLKGTNPLWTGATSRPYPARLSRCDLVIPGQWALEVKLLRPFGDNGMEAEHWSENGLHPYEGNVSALGDALKLKTSGFTEKRAILIVGYEHTPPRIPVAPVLVAIESVAPTLGLALGPREAVLISGLIHPVHQQAVLAAWEVR